jgi:hypothetical protein
MITFMGITMTYEVALFMASLLVTEVLPFLPGKYNGIAQSFVRLLGKVKLNQRDGRIDLIIDRLDRIQRHVEGADTIPADLDNVLAAVRGLTPKK